MNPLAEEIQEEYSFGQPGEYMLVNVGDIHMGIPVAQVKEFKDISSLPMITEIPIDTNYVKGLINVRGQVIPVLSLREYKGVKSYFKERLDLIELLKSMEAEHKTWLDELEKATHERREAKIERDPLKCNFGKWYYNYKSEDFSVMAHLLRFDGPHREIHEIAEQVENYILTGQFAKAEELLIFTRENTLHRMMELFEELYQVLATSSREILIIVNGFLGDIGLIVDAVKHKYFLTQEDIQQVWAKDSLKLIGRTDEFLMDLFDAESILLRELVEFLRKNK